MPATHARPSRLIPEMNSVAASGQLLVEHTANATGIDEVEPNAR